MTALRKRRGGYVTVDNRVAEDARLSFRARGVLLYLLAKPDGWDVRSTQIADDGAEGREAIRTALRELGAAGYYRRVIRRLPSGQCVTETEITAVPDPAWRAEWARSGDVASETTGDGFPGVGLPGAGLPDAGLPDAGLLGASVSTSQERNLKNPPTPTAGAVGEPGTEDEEPGPGCARHQRRRSSCPECQAGVKWPGYGQRPDGPPPPSPPTDPEVRAKAVKAARQAMAAARANRPAGQQPVEDAAERAS